MARKVHGSKCGCKTATIVLQTTTRGTLMAEDLSQLTGLEPPYRFGVSGTVTEYVKDSTGKATRKKMEGSERLPLDEMEQYVKQIEHFFRNGNFKMGETKAVLKKYLRRRIITSDRGENKVVELELSYQLKVL